VLPAAGQPENMVHQVPRLRNQQMNAADAAAKPPDGRDTGHPCTRQLKGRTAAILPSQLVTHSATNQSTQTRSHVTPSTYRAAYIHISINISMVHPFHWLHSLASIRRVSPQDAKAEASVARQVRTCSPPPGAWPDSDEEMIIPRLISRRINVGPAPTFVPATALIGGRPRAIRATFTPPTRFHPLPIAPSVAGSWSQPAGPIQGKAQLRPLHQSRPTVAPDHARGRQ